MKINIKLDKRASGLSEKGFPIVVRFYKSKVTKIRATGFFSLPEHWNDDFSLPTKEHPDNLLLTDYIDMLKLKINELQRNAINGQIAIETAIGLLFGENFETFYGQGLHVCPNPEDVSDTRVSALKDFDKYCPNIAPNEIDRDIVANYIASRLKYRKPSGVRSYVISLTAIYNKIGGGENPFSGHRILVPKKINVVADRKTINVLENQLMCFTRAIGGGAHYRNYWLLMFYLGGIDPEVLAKLRYDENVRGERIVFNRAKGGSNVACNNLIVPQAWEILRLYDCKPYLVPIYKAYYPSFRRNFTRRFKEQCEEMGIVQLRPKGARYSFVHLAQELLIDERLTAQIVGHKRNTVTSLYANDFSLSAQDEAHLKIISV